MSPIIQNFPDATLIPNGDGTYRLGVDIGQAVSINITGVSIAGNMNQGNAGAQAWPVSLPVGASINVSGTVNQGLPGTQAWPVSLPTGTSFGAVNQGSAGASPWPVSLTSIPTGTVLQGNSPWTVDTELPAAAALADAVSNPTTPTVGAFVGAYNGASFDRLRVPTKIIDMSAIDIHAIATVWTPAGGKKFRLMGGQFSVSAVCSVLFEDNAGGNTVGGRTPKLLADTPYSFDWGNGFLSAAANNVLKATSSASATITGYLYGTEE